MSISDFLSLYLTCFSPLTFAHPLYGYVADIEHLIPVEYDQ
jgi:hypothetical protein